ncbi:DUF2868 domain-containing protein [Glaciecola sp. 1036]|uniref:DUF2868 domain-containing protein n=1 Tax=Alteromonadaceae TaxID=72275 RepID=UPI003D08F4ED
MQPVVLSNQPNTLTKLSLPIIILGCILGLFLSIAVLSGDAEGRVNLFYLLLVYLFIPVLGALISVGSLLGNKGVNFARLVSDLPIWSSSQRAYLAKIRQIRVEKQWFFLQSQAAALAYATASLITFLLLLLATDINFVWRSTVLTAEQLLPVLKVVASPWWFWEDAQPTAELLRLTQDSRLNASYTNTGSFGQWWAFVLATQVVYSFLLRGLLLLFAKWWVKKLTNSESKNTSSLKTKPIVNKFSENHKLSDISRSLPAEYALINWAGLPDDIVSQLALHPNQILEVGPLTNNHTEAAFDIRQIILVKAWEPPMGELQDFMKHNKGLLYPVNYKHNKLVPALPNHLEEWQRFTAEMSDWGVYQERETGEHNNGE